MEEVEEVEEGGVVDVARARGKGSDPSLVASTSYMTLQAFFPPAPDPRHGLRDSKRDGGKGIAMKKKKKKGEKSV